VDSVFESDVAARLHDLKVYREAKRREANELWTPPARPLSLYEQLADNPPEVDWIMPELWPGGILQVNAQKKSGKTTLMINGARSLVTREPFLARFAFNGATDCRVGYLNMELPRGQMNQWFVDLDMPEEAQKRIVPYHGRESGALDFSSDAVVEWLIAWLRDEGIQIAFLDPLSAFYNQTRWGSGDPNDPYLRWWAVLEHIVLGALES
jgi:hypothetical protein